MNPSQDGGLNDGNLIEARGTFDDRKIDPAVLRPQFTHLKRHRPRTAASGPVWSRWWQSRRFAPTGTSGRQSAHGWRRWRRSKFRDYAAFGLGPGHRHRDGKSIRSTPRSAGFRRPRFQFSGPGLSQPGLPAPHTARQRPKPALRPTGWRRVAPTGCRRVASAVLYPTSWRPQSAERAPGQRVASSGLQPTRR